jgi:hypothetical protein
MPDTVTSAVFHEGLHRLEGLIVARFDILDKKLEDHEREDHAVATRVTRLEERQAADKELRLEALDKANRRSTLISSIVATIVVAGSKLIEYLHH